MDQNSTKKVLVSITSFLEYLNNFYYLQIAKTIDIDYTWLY